MPRKRPRTDADVERLAAEFRERWTPAYGISPWLRRMAPRLHRMVRDDSWSWADIGRAMTVAGITYESGKPWTGPLLMTKAAQARKQLRDRADRSPLPPASAPQPAPMVTMLPPEERPRLAPERAGWLEEPGDATGPTFALASLSPSEFQQPPPAPVQPSTPKPAPPRPRVDADEILRRLQGGTLPRDKKE